MASNAIVARGLRRSYGPTRALDGFDLTVPAGTVCGLLGPNGAGKTTAVQALATLLRLDAGRAEVAGFDIQTEPERVRAAIGLTGQYASVDEVLTGRENLVMFGRLHGLSGAAARRRAGELLERFGLTDAARRPVRQYSGGMRRRIDLAASLVMAPAVLFLDEPTTGLDPRSRNQMWEAVRGLVATGTTVLLTTQYLEEADQLADRITVIDHGRAIAEGTAAELKTRVGGDQLDVVARRAEDLPAVAEIVGRVTGATAQVTSEERRVSAPVTDRVARLGDALLALDGAGVAVEDIGVRRPTLDEVFLALTGQRTATTTATADEPAPAGV